MLPHLERRGSTSVDKESKRFRYKVYGLIVESEVELPELIPAGQQQPDVHIRLGHVPETLESPIIKWPWCVASNSEYVFTVEGVARYHIADGRMITIERRLDLPNTVPPADIRLWLLGSAFAALIHQRGQLPLHVSAIKAPRGVWAFTGNSGEGKSTLAGFLRRRYAWELVSDDVSVIDPASTGPVIYPGPRKLKLWADALEYLDFKDCNIARDLSNTEKFQLYLPSETAYEPERLHGLVMLESADDNDDAVVEKLNGVAAFNACLCAVHRPYMETWFKLPQDRMRQMVQLCRATNVYRFRRPRSLHGFEGHLQPLLDLIMEEGK